MSEDRNITPMPVPTAVRDRAIVTAPIAASIPPWRRQQSWLRLKAAAGQPVSDDRAVRILDPFSIERGRLATACRILLKSDDPGERADVRGFLDLLQRERRRA